MRSTTPRIRAAIGVITCGCAIAAVVLPVSAAGAADVRDVRFARFYGETGAPSDTVVGVPATVATDLARRINRIEKLRQRLAHQDGFLRSADEETLLLLFNRTEGKAELLRAYAPTFGAQAVPEALFRHLDLALDGLWQEITRLAPTYGAPGGHPFMKELSVAVERRLRVSVPKATFVGGMLREKEWRVKRSSLGIPESRSMSGVVYYRLPDQPWLICREFEVAQQYFKENPEGLGKITFGPLRLQA
jgi:hypothetical protein